MTAPIPTDTTFFRDIHPFETLRDYLLPELIALRAGSAPLRIWCAGASSGQEPYSIAMVLSEHFPEVAGRTTILCTDVNFMAVERCARGAFSQAEANRGLPAAMLVKWFQRAGTNWIMKPELRGMVQARILDLVEPWSGVERIDIVFLRNVLTHFGTATRRAVLARVRGAMAMDGFLFVGAAETLLDCDEGLVCGAAGKSTFYRRAA